MPNFEEIYSAALLAAQSPLGIEDVQLSKLLESTKDNPVEIDVLNLENETPAAKLAAEGEILAAELLIFHGAKVDLVAKGAIKGSHYNYAGRLWKEKGASLALIAQAFQAKIPNQQALIRNFMALEDEVFRGQLASELKSLTFLLEVPHIYAKDIRILMREKNISYQTAFWSHIMSETSKCKDSSIKFGFNHMIFINSLFSIEDIWNAINEGLTKEDVLNLIFTLIYIGSYVDAQNSFLDQCCEYQKSHPQELFAPLIKSIEFSSMPFLNKKDIIKKLYSAVGEALICFIGNHIITIDENGKIPIERLAPNLEQSNLFLLSYWRSAERVAGCTKEVRSNKLFNPLISYADSTAKMPTNKEFTQVLIILGILSSVLNNQINTSSSSSISAIMLGIRHIEALNKFNSFINQFPDLRKAFDDFKFGCLKALSVSLVLDSVSTPANAKPKIKPQSPQDSSASAGGIFSSKKPEAETKVADPLMNMPPVITPP